VKDEEGPGVPEALPRTLQRLAGRLEPREIDRLWIFPPLMKGRKEWGLVAVSCFSDGGIRRLITASYQAERTGTSLTVDCTLAEEGLAPPDRLPRVMTGVERRSELALGDPRMVEIGGEENRFKELLEEFDPGLFERAETVET
jgi:hypothetical protein